MNSAKKLSRVRKINHIEKPEPVAETKAQEPREEFMTMPGVEEQEKETIRTVVEPEPEPVVEPVKKRRGRPRKNPLPEENVVEPVKEKRKTKKNILPEEEKNICSGS